MVAKHKPTPETRAQVSALYSYGHTQVEIATYIGICDDTLHYHYHREMATAKITANAEVARKLYNKAVNQDDLSAQIFWLKTRAQWKTADNQDTTEGKLLEEMQELRKALTKKNEKDY